MVHLPPSFFLLTFLQDRPGGDLQALVGGFLILLCGLSDFLGCDELGLLFADAMQGNQGGADGDGIVLRKGFPEVVGTFLSDDSAVHQMGNVLDAVVAHRRRGSGVLLDCLQVAIGFVGGVVAQHGHQFIADPIPRAFVPAHEVFAVEEIYHLGVVGVESARGPDGLDELVRFALP